MLITDIPKRLKVCPLCGNELEYMPHPCCGKCRETFEYDPTYDVFRNPHIIDISYREPRSGILSNLYPHHFKFNGDIEYASMEAFLRGLCWDGAKETLENEIAPLFGVNAVNVKYAFPDWRKSQKLYWLGRKIERESKEYQELLQHAYICLCDSSRLFRMALFQTKGKVLIHSIGKDNPKETLLTQEEFIYFLNMIRKQL